MPFQSKAQWRLFGAKSKEPGSGITRKKLKQWARKSKGYATLPEKKAQKR